MRDTERETKEFERAFLGLLIGLGIIVLVVILTSCKTQVKVVTEYRDRVVHDTTQVVDSIYQDRVHYVMQRGDTIFKTDSVFLYKYKYLNRDVEVYIHDSIPYAVEVEKPVKYRSGYDKFTSWAFWIIVLLVLGYVGWKLLRKYYLHI